MTIHLKSGWLLTVSADKFSAGAVQRVGESGAVVAYGQTEVLVSSSVTVGPFTTDRTYDITSTQGALTYEVAQPDSAAPLSERAGPLAIQTTTVPVGVDQTIPARAQAVVFGPLSLAGTIRCAGDLHIKV
jgi:hypothetical protein